MRYPTKPERLIKNGDTKVNGTPHFAVLNPLEETINEAKEIGNRLEEAADVLNEAIRHEKDINRQAREAADHYDMLEAEQLAEVFMQAKMKEGPLAGIATSSKAYDIALSDVRNKLRSGELAHAWRHVEESRNELDSAKLDVATATNTFNAMRKLSELNAAILRAASI